MKRRTFMKYSMVTGATLILPNTALEAYSFDEAFKDAKKYGKTITNFVGKEGGKLIKSAVYCSKLNPVRFFGGLVYDEVKPILVEVADDIVDFIKGKLEISDLHYAGMDTIRSKSIEHDPYKASVITLDTDKTAYRVLKNNQIELELKENYELNKFAQIQQYLKDEETIIKLYNKRRASSVGNDLTPDDLLNIEYISFGSNQRRHIEEVLKITNNNAFSELVG